MKENNEGAENKLIDDNKVPKNKGWDFPLNCHSLISKVANSSEQDTCTHGLMR